MSKAKAKVPASRHSGPSRGSARRAAASCSESSSEEEPSQPSKRSRHNEQSEEEDRDTGDPTVQQLLAELIRNQRQSARDQRADALEQKTANKLLTATLNAFMERSAPASAQKSPSVRKKRYFFKICVYINLTCS